MIVGPGRTWYEKGDRGWDRVALPFAVVERNANCVHNGNLVFLHRPGLVSRVQFQITQETCQHFKFNPWAA